MRRQRSILKVGESLFFEGARRTKNDGGDHSLPGGLRIPEKRDNLRDLRRYRLFRHGSQLHFLAGNAPNARCDVGIELAGAVIGQLRFRKCRRGPARRLKCRRQWRRHDDRTIPAHRSARSFDKYWNRPGRGNSPLDWWRSNGLNRAWRWRGLLALIVQQSPQFIFPTCRGRLRPRSRGIGTGARGRLLVTLVAEQCAQQINDK
jgi:hypothetical protein